MATSGDNLRFQVFVNGQLKGTAGIANAGVLTAVVSWVRRDLAKATDEIRQDPDFTPESWIENQTHLSLGGLNSSADEHVTWYWSELNVGDEVTIRLLPPGETDEPPERVSRADGG